MSKKRHLEKNYFDNSNIQLTPKQTELFDGIKRNTMTIVHGAAGTSKTFTSCYTALALYVNNKVDKIIITKPMEESGNSGVGFLPGTLEDKTAPFKKSFLSNFEKIIGPEKLDILIKENVIIFEPLAYMRGTTYENSCMLIDEAQNCSVKDLMLWATRMGGERSYAVIMGDTSQYDVKARYSGLRDFIEMVDGLKDLLIFKFLNSDIVRHKFLIELTDRYDQYRNTNTNTNTKDSTHYANKR